MFPAVIQESMNEPEPDRNQLYSSVLIVYNVSETETAGIRYEICQPALTRMPRNKADIQYVAIAERIDI